MSDDSAHRTPSTGAELGATQLEDVPQELKDLRQWVCYRVMPKPDGGLDKWPINPSYTGRRASTTDPTTWSTFEHATNVARMHPALAGVGFVFAGSDPYCGVDFDGCVEGGEVDPWVASWLGKLGGYQEISQSESGVHCIVKARLPGGGKKRIVEGHKVEVYDQARFFVVTGRKMGGAPEGAQAAVEDLYRTMDPPPKVAREMKRLRSPVMDDEELLDKARTADNGHKFRKLYDEGDWPRLKYPSQSEADNALVNLLIFWTGGDREQIMRLFEAGALYRPPKDKGKDYVARTVDGALAGGYRGGYYDPKHKGKGIRDELGPYFALTDNATAWKGGKRPAARKVLIGMLLVASEHGVRTEKGVSFGIDLRTLSELAHVSLKTLCTRSLPLLAKEGVVKWGGKGSGGRASRFLLPLPGVCRYNIRSSHAYNVVPTHTLGGDERKELLRASMGRSPFAEISRIGNAKQTILEIMVGTPKASLSVSYLARITGRRRPDVRRNMRELNGLNLALEVSDDHYALPDDLWDRWDDVLRASGVTTSESRKKERHERERDLQRLARAGWQQHHEGGRELWVHPDTGELVPRPVALSMMGYE